MTPESAPVRDPRDIVTPDAFQVDPDLLGAALARPWPRLFAFVIDAAVVGVLTALTRSFTILIWAAIAFFLLSMSFRRPSRERGVVTTWIFRGATGCLGLVVLFAVGIGVLVTVGGGDRSPRTIALGDDTVSVEGPALLQTLALGVGGFAGLKVADDTTSAREAATVLLVAAAPGELTRDEWRGLLREATPDDAPWRADAELVYDRAIAAVAESLGLAADADRTAAADPAVPSQDSAVVRRDSLLLASLPPFVTDSLATLGARVERLTGERDRARAEQAELQAQVAAAEGSLVALIADLWGQLGSAFGLFSMYFTIALAVFDGRTVGKRVMRLRVVRLDGMPIGWWSSFERAGGYAAGLATGLLGFAQILWDDNRQSIQDRIGGTVVIRD